MRYQKDTDVPEITINDLRTLHPEKDIECEVKFLRI